MSIPKREIQTIILAKHRMRQIQMSDATAPATKRATIKCHEARKSSNKYSKFCHVEKLN